MDLNEYREQFIIDIEDEAIAEQDYPINVFLKRVEDLLIYDYKLLSGIEYCYFELPYNQKTKQKKISINGAYFESAANTLHLVGLDYNNGEMTSMKKDDFEDRIKSLRNYFIAVVEGYFTNGEKSDPAVQQAFEIRRQLTNNNIYKINFIVATTNMFTNGCSVVEIPGIEVNGNKISADITSLDIGAIYKTKLEGFEKPALNIVTKEFGLDGIPCIQANLSTNNYQAFLAIVPGKFLADIYDKYNSRLLEDNVRSFLNFRGGVNKGIRSTIKNEPDNFFAYNNGISATCSDVKLEFIEGRGYVIIEMDNLQIINGGQTTASITATLHKDKVSLDDIYVQMKLTQVSQRNDIFVRNIAKFANSQNKVTAADLNSNHEFYIRMENFSRKLYTPKINNSTIQTMWFFERARGQYDQVMMNVTKSSELKTFKLHNPASQKITKTDLAKYLNSAAMRPYDVAWGADVNATKFYAIMEEDWKKNEASYNELFYKKAVGMALLFKKIEQLISAQSWYQERNGYRAQLVTYTFSKLVYEVVSKKMLIDYLSIWNKQEVHNTFDNDIIKIAKICFDNFYDPSIANISTYCKKKDTWAIIKNFKYELEAEVFDVLISESDEKIADIAAKKDQRLDNKVSIEIQIFNMGKVKWQELKEKALNDKILNKHDSDLLDVAIRYCKNGSGCSSSQAEAIWKIKSQLHENCID